MLKNNLAIVGGSVKNSYHEYVMLYCHKHPQLYSLLSVNILEQVLRSFPYIHIMDMHPVDLSLDHCSMLAVW